MQWAVGNVCLCYRQADQIECEPHTTNRESMYIATCGIVSLTYRCKHMSQYFSTACHLELGNHVPHDVLFYKNLYYHFALNLQEIQGLIKNSATLKFQQLHSTLLLYLVLLHHRF